MTAVPVVRRGLLPDPCHHCGGRVMVDADAYGDWTRCMSCSREQAPPPAHVEPETHQMGTARCRHCPDTVAARQGRLAL